MTFRRPRESSDAALRPAQRRRVVLRTAVVILVAAGATTSVVWFASARARTTGTPSPVAFAQSPTASPSSTASPAPSPSPTPTPSPTPSLSKSARSALTKRLSAYLDDRSGELSVQIEDLDTGLSYGYNTKQRHATASIVKVDILVTLLLRAQGEDRGLSDDERALAKRMITASDNNAATALWNRVGGTAGVAAANKKLHLRDTTPGPGGLWGTTMTTVADQIRLLKSLTSKKSLISAKNRSYALGLMGDVLSSQDWGVSAAADRGDTTALKNGWLPRPVDGGRWTINSIGRVHGDDHDYLIAVLTTSDRSMSDGIATVEHVSKVVSDALSKAISTSTTQEDG
jgi:beta-lactamase class A